MNNSEIDSLEAGGKLDTKDKTYNGRPLGWAEHEGQHEIAGYLRQRAGGV